MTKQPEPPRPRDRASLEAFVKSFPYWYHHIYLGQGVYTTPERRLHNLVWDWLEKPHPSRRPSRKVGIGRWYERWLLLHPSEAERRW